MKTAVTFLGILAVVALLAVGYLIWDSGGKLKGIDQRIQKLEDNFDKINKDIKKVDVRVKEIEKILHREEVAYNQRVRIEDEALQNATISRISFTPSRLDKSEGQKQSVNFVLKENYEDSDGKEHSIFIHVNSQGKEQLDPEGREQKLQLSKLPKGGIVFAFPHFPAYFEPSILELPRVEPSNYKDVSYERDPVIVEFFTDKKDKEPIFSREYIPYGSVVTGEINVSIKNTRQKKCEELILDTISKSEKYSESVGKNIIENNESNIANQNAESNEDDSDLCFVNLLIEEDTDTQEVIDFLNDEVEDVIVSRNVLLSANNGSNDFDPTCDQTKKWLKPFSGIYTRSSKDDLESLPQVSPQSPLDTVTVVLMGGGIGKDPDSFGATVLTNQEEEGDNIFAVDDITSEDWFSSFGQNFVGKEHDENGIHINIDSDYLYDEFVCPNAESGEDEWVGHDTHIAQIIYDRVPGAQIEFLPFKVCDHRGSCATDDIIKAFKELKKLQEQNEISDKVIVNISLGGPLPDGVLHQIIQDGSPSSDCTSCPKFLVLASAGNKPDILEHYPADYAFNPDFDPIGKAKASADNGGYVYEPLTNVLSVRATGRKGPNNDWQNANEINRERANLQAEGVNLCPATHDVDECDLSDSSIKHGGLIGTSFAAASATGLATHHAQSLPLFSTSGGDNVYNQLLLEIPMQN